MTSPARANGAAHPWKAILKTGAVLAGYAAAFAVASYVHQLNTQGPDAQASDDMYDLANDFVFVQVFCGLGLFPTGLALYFLRPVRAFWTILAIAAFAFAATGPIAAAAIVLASHVSGLPSFCTAWASLGVLRVLPAPLFAAAFLLGGVSRRVGYPAGRCSGQASLRARSLPLLSSIGSSRLAPALFRLSIAG